MKKLIMLLVLMLSIAMVGCSDQGSRKFKCTQYDSITNIMDSNGLRELRLDMLKEYKTYELVLELDNTFTLTVRLKEESKSSKYSGTYTEADNKITLNYIDNYFDEQFETPIYTVSSDGKTLSRRQNIYTDEAKNNLLHIVEQKFELK